MPVRTGPENMNATEAAVLATVPRPRRLAKRKVPMPASGKWSSISRSRARAGGREKTLACLEQGEDTERIHAAIRRKLEITDAGHSVRVFSSTKLAIQRLTDMPADLAAALSRLSFSSSK